MSSQEQHTQVKYSEVSPFQISDGFTRNTRMEPVKTIRIFIAAIAANISAFAVGTCLGWTSPMSPKLKAQDPTDSPLDRPITTEEDAWISSLVALGALIAPFVAGPLADRIGRKWVLLSSSVFFVFAYILMMVASEVWILYLGRLIQGFGVGFVMTVQPMYVGEIATDAVRGATGSLMQLFIVSGILYVYAIGPYVSYVALQWCCLAVPIVFDVIFFFMPESPYYYAGKGQKTDALNSLQFLRGQSMDVVQDEMTVIQGEVEEAMANRGTVVDLIRNTGNRKALIISAGLIVFQQLSGINVVLFNSQSIFVSADTGLDPAVAAIIIGAVQVGSSGMTPIIADRLGLDRLFALTNDRPNELWIKLEDFHDEERFAKYTDFAIGDMDENYLLKKLNGYSGDAGDSLVEQKGCEFSTHDRDNDNDPTKSCAETYDGAWWYNRCHDSNLNGRYIRGGYYDYQQEAQGIDWYSWHGHQYSLRYVHMAIRPKYDF
uniref:Facilitated trehalose transporter Tret1 n=1 Tax=Bactrocera dorsalis TaxID=27457 RepID=A0A034W7W8_BACDO